MGGQGQEQHSWVPSITCTAIEKSACTFTCLALDQKYVIVAHPSDPSTGTYRQENQEFKARVSYVVSKPV